MRLELEICNEIQAKGELTTSDIVNRMNSRLKLKFSPGAILAKCRHLKAIGILESQVISREDIWRIK